MKYLLLAVALVGLMVRGYFLYQSQQIHSAQGAMQSARQTIGQVRSGQAGPDAAADAAARGAAAPAAVPVANKAPAPGASGSPSVNVNGTARGEIDAALNAMHLTTIMPGQPGLVIIDKQEYSEGEDLPLPKGRKARITSVQDDGVRVTCEGMAFRLDPPAAPDLDALRKNKKK